MKSILDFDGGERLYSLICGNGAPNCSRPPEVASIAQLFPSSFLPRTLTCLQADQPGSPPGFAELGYVAPQTAFPGIKGVSAILRG
jgi:hypothetical protein